MRPLAFLCLLVAPAAWPQTLSFGIKAGVPLTDEFKGPGTFSLRPSGRQTSFGPVVKLNLPFRLAVELDALYRPVQYQRQAPDGSYREVSGSSWELPLLLTHHLGEGPARPFVAAGLAFRNLRGFSGDLPELRERSAVGAVLGGGLELRVTVVRVSGELRYTRWGSASFRLGEFRSQLNQAEFLLGLTF